METQRQVQTLDDLGVFVSEMKNELQDVLETYKSLVDTLMCQSTEKKTSVILKQIEADLKNVQAKYVLVEKKDLSRLQREMGTIKNTLPKILNKELLNAPLKIMEKEQDNQKLRAENQSLEREMRSIKQRYNAILSEIEQERQENVELRVQVSEIKEILNEQSDYCAKLGASTCALLWRVSQDDCMQTMLSGDSGKEFLHLASYTLESYAAALSDDQSKLKDANNEHRFVLALVGVLTNISASAYGREFLIACVYGKELLNILMTLLKELSMNEDAWTKLRNLSLRIIYNISINQKGIKFICSKKQLLETVSMIIEGDKCCDNRVHAIRLIQSIITEADCVEAAHTIVERFPVDKLRMLAQHSRGEVQSCLQEMLTDIKLLEREQ